SGAHGRPRMACLCTEQHLREMALMEHSFACRPSKEELLSQLDCSESSSSWHSDGRPAIGRQTRSAVTRSIVSIARASLGPARVSLMRIAFCVDKPQFLRYEPPPCRAPRYGLVEPRPAHTALRYVCSAFDRSRL